MNQRLSLFQTHCCLGEGEGEGLESRVEKRDLLTRLGWLCLVAVIWSTLVQLVSMVKGYHTNRFGG